MISRIIVWSALSSVFIAAMFFLLFARDINIPAEKFSRADAVVVFTGGTGRADEGLRLFRDGKGKYLIISGVETESGLEAIFPNKRLRKMIDLRRIILDTKSRSTLENALNVQKIIEEKHIKSLVLVTSDYHISRAFTILRASLTSDIEIYRYPVKGPNFKIEWWRDWKSAQLVMSEFLKFCWFHLWQRWFYI